MKIDLAITNSTKTKIDTKNLNSLVEDFLVFTKLEGNWYLELAFVSKNEIHQLNKEHRRVDNPTDVLSFPVGFALLEKTSLPAISYKLSANSLGSIIICPDYAFEKKSSTIDTDDPYTLEIPDLVIHGLMHLLGNDHEDDNEFNQWEQTITEFWSRHPRR